MSRINIPLQAAILLLTVVCWGFLGWRLLIARGTISGSIATTWSDMARRQVWGHWVSTNGTPTIVHGSAELQAGQQYEFAVEPTVVCHHLQISSKAAGDISIISRDRPKVVPTDKGFLTSALPKVIDGYHFLLQAKTTQTLSALTFRCQP